MTSSANQSIDPRDWLLLVGLSIVWGAAFFFHGVAMKELPLLTIVFLRVSLAALILYAIVRIQGVALPHTLIGWLPFVVMALLNNVIPFSLLIAGQAATAGGIAAIINATTPLFTVLIMAAAGDERLLPRRVVGVMLGVVGVVILRGDHLSGSTREGTGVLFCLGAAFFYGLSALHARRHLASAPPLQTASCQLIASGVMMAVIAGSVDRPWTLHAPSGGVIAAIVALALFSTALAYILFFQIVRRSGSTNVMLVTLLIPVTAIFLGVTFLGEAIRGRDIAGALVIASALLIIDGRLLTWIRGRRPVAAES